jgi:hypothetical protein
MITTRKSLSFAAGLLFAAALFSSADAADSVGGSWTARSSETPERMQVSFVYGHSSQSSDDWNLSALKGLDLAPSARHDVHFTIEGDAGRIEADGSASSGTAAGGFQFTPNPAYPAELRKLGLGEIKPDSQIGFALHDVSLSFAREMAALKIDGLTADKLMAFRIHGVQAVYVKDVRAAGAHASDADQLIAFRIHSVSPTLISSLRPMGGVPEDSKLVALAIHGASSDWVSRFNDLGYGGGAVSADQLIAFRIHDVTPDFVSALEKQGYRHPAPEQLIALRIHGVTPDYISSIKSKGVKDVSLDQVVAMKIHGID